MSSASDITAAIKKKIIRFESTDNSHPKGTYTQDNSYRLSLLQQNKDCCPVVEDTSISYDIFVIMGQSNAQGQGTQLTSVDTTPVSGVMQLGRMGANYNKIIAAVDPLQHSTVNGGSGFPFSFGRTYKNATGRNVLLVPAAKSGSNIEAWSKTRSPATFQDDVAENTFRGINIYTEALTRTLTAFNTNPNNRICGILWHQGEGNTGDDTDELYFTRLEAFMADFRSDLFANGVTNALYLPWLFGEFVPEWMLSTAGDANVRPNGLALFRDGIKAVASLPNNGWVTSQAISGDTILVPNGSDTNGARIHFNSESLRRFGVRYYNVYNTIISSPVASVTNITFKAVSPTNLSIVFSVNNNRVTKFVLEVFLNSTSIVSTELRPSVRTYKLTLFNSEETYTIKITPYYNDSKGIEFTKTYSPTPSNTIPSLNMRIFSNDNLTVSDVAGFRSISKIENSDNKFFVNSVMNIDHNGNNRLMYVINGGGLSVNGDVPPGDISSSAWVKLATSIKFPIPPAGAFRNAGLFFLSLNGSSPANSYKCNLSLSANGIAGPNVENTNFTILHTGSTTDAGIYGSSLSVSSWFGNTNMRADGWLHLATTFDNTSKVRCVYVNGVCLASDVQSTISNTGLLASAGRTSNSIFIGTTPGLSVSEAVNNFSVYGFMNDIRMYSKVLTPVEVNNIYALNY